MLLRREKDSFQDFCWPIKRYVVCIRKPKPS